MRRGVMLRILRTMFGLKAKATDGALGRVKDFYFDDWVWMMPVPGAGYGGMLFGAKDRC
jgi:hypothetical protein